VQLAQVNVAEAVAPLSSPRLHGFVQLLDRIDELARRSPGFVWRPRPAEVTAADVALFGDPPTREAFGLRRVSRHSRPANVPSGLSRPRVASKR
jgi:hypothetical protein